MRSGAAGRRSEVRRVQRADEKEHGERGEAGAPLARGDSIGRYVVLGRWAAAGWAMEKTLGPNAADVATSLGNMGDPLSRLGRFEEALALNARALHILEAAGDQELNTPICLAARGAYLNALGRFAEAETLAQRATEIFELKMTVDNAYVAYSLAVLGISYLGQDRPREALAPLARAYDLRTRLDPDPSRLGEAAFALAQALWRAHRDRPRARALAGEAERAYVKTPETRALADVRLWLQGHAPL